MSKCSRAFEGSKDKLLDIQEKYEKIGMINTQIRVEELGIWIPTTEIVVIHAAGRRRVSSIGVRLSRNISIFRNLRTSRKDTFRGDSATPTPTRNP